MDTPRRTPTLVTVRTAVRAATRALATASALALGCFLTLGPGCLTSAGDGADSCTSACMNHEAHGCAGTCDCTKCSTAPASCANALVCQQFASSCGDYTSCPAPPADCVAFMATVCE